MGKIKVRKDVLEQMTSKLQASKNIFSRGDFDEYKIENMGVTPDGQVYDLDNPTEKFYYDLKMKFAENNKEIEKSAKGQLIKKLVHIHDSKGRDYFANRSVKVIEDAKIKEKKKNEEISNRTKNYQKLVNILKIYEVNLTDEEKRFVLRKKKDCSPKWASYTNPINKKVYKSKFYISSHRQKIQKEEDFAVYLSSMGFSVYLIPEESSGGKKVDAIVNGVPVDFKKVGLGNWAIPNEYKDGMKKNNSNGVLIQVPKELPGYRYDGELLDLDSFVKKNTRKEDGIGKPKNGILAIWIEDVDEFKVFDMKKIRAEHDRTAQGRANNISSNSNISQQNNLSSKNVTKSLKPDYNGENRKGQTFDINITDITENNKQQKLEQVSKALNAIANNQPFIIKHIPADASTSYGDLLVRIRDFDKSKIEKAVHKIALSLDADVLASSKGESFVYESQKEITEKFYKTVTDSARAVYNFVIAYFDLPDIRIISKAGELRHKGKIIYNPETGMPVKESEWKKFIVELEKFLNRNYSGVGEKIVLSAESLGIILDRLSKTNSLDAIRKMSLSQIKAKRYDVDWISESVKNMKDKFGDIISRERQARIQIAVDSAAQRVTRVKDDMRNNIQQIIIDGIRDKQSKSVVAQNLFDKCASMNRDMQRIADSEVQMAVNSSYCKEEVYNTEPGEKVYFKRFEMNDDNTCRKCRKLNGTIVLWSDVPLPDEHIRDPYAKYAIWEGKNEGDCPIGIVHPYCYSDDTEVMTNNGWKLFKDVEKNDKIMSINPETKEIDFVPFVKQVQYEYNGKMIHFPGRNFDLLVTPDHNMLYLAGNGHGERKLKGIKASELIKNIAFALPRAIGEWKHTDTKTVRFGDLTISKAQYFRLWAWYLAEGSGRSRNGGYEVKLAQKDPMKIYNDLPELQSVLHIGEESVYLLGDYARYFECMFGIYADKKFIPPFIKNSSVENIREFLDAFVMADGTRLSNHKCSSEKAYSEFRNEQVLRTSSKKMADDLCEMIVKAGWMPSEFVVKEKGKLNHFKNGDYVLNTDCHNISICKSKTRTYAPDMPGHLPRHNPVEVDYKGMVYDVELEKWHFLLVRRNGKCAWSGNCRGSWVRYYPGV